MRRTGKMTAIERTACPRFKQIFGRQDPFEARASSAFNGGHFSSPPHAFLDLRNSAFPQDGYLLIYLCRNRRGKFIGLISANVPDIPCKAFLLRFSKSERYFMRRLANPPLSSVGEAALAQYRQALWEHEDLTDASRRNYLSDLRHFAAWYEANSIGKANETDLSRTEFCSQAITTTTLTRYHTYLQKK